MIGLAAPVLPAFIETGQVYKTLLQESLARFPQSDFAFDWQWQLVSQEKGDFYNVSMPFVKYIQEGIDSQTIPVDLLDKWLAKRSFVMEDITNVSNLIGNGKSASVFYIKDQTNIHVDFSGIFGLVQVSEKNWLFVQIHPWRGHSWGDTRFEVADYNDNGQPDITVYEHFWGSGSSTWEDDLIAIYEWRSAEMGFVNIAQLIPTVETDEWLQGFAKWEFMPSQPPVLAVKYFYNTPLEDCPEIGYQHLYTWNGDQYQLSAQGFLPYTPTVEIICNAAWAVLAGDENPEAVSVLKTSLDTNSGELEANEGPAAVDYFRFRLGVLYALHGQRQAAIETLQQVANSSVRPDFHLAAQLARTYLDAYRTFGAVEACSRTQVVFDSALDGIHFQISNYDLTSMLEKWGFADIFLRNGSPEWLCSSRAAFRLALTQDQPGDFSAFSRWLANAKLDYLRPEEADLTGDGTSDWVVAWRTPAKPAYWQVWAVVRDQAELKPVLIAELYVDDDKRPEQELFSLLPPAPGQPPIGILQIQSVVLAFRLEKSAAQAAHVLLKEDAWSFSAIPAEVGISIQNKEAWFEKHAYSSQTYVWDIARQKLTLKSQVLKPQEAEIARIEQLLWIENRPAEAIESLKLLLAGDLEKPQEELNLAPGINQTEVIRPYLTYLLGLACELTGDERCAVENYWSIWKNYPENFFGVAAQKKLELKP